MIYIWRLVKFFKKSCLVALIEIFSISANVKEHLRCILPVLPSPITAIFVRHKNGKLEQKFYEKEKISVLEQEKINLYYTALGAGDSGAGVIMNGGPMGGHKDTRSTILAVLRGGTSFAAHKQNLRPDECIETVSRLTQEEIDWIKQIDQEHYDESKLEFTIIITNYIRI